MGNTQDIVDLLKFRKNLILTGAPGTGKTYKTKEIAVALCDGKILSDSKQLNERYKKLTEEGRIVFTTFHQSYDYEEFVEGLKPELNEESVGTGKYILKKGIFKEICERAKVIEGNIREEYQNLLVEIFAKKPKERFIQIDKKNGEPFKAMLIGEKAKDPIVYPNNNGEIGEKNKLYENTIIDIWKTYNTVEKFDNIKNISDSFRNVVGVGGCSSRYWAVMNYIWKQISPKGHDHVLIIDEINRGNISKIFGELITLLEKDKRLNEEREISVKLPYSQDDFTVPPNLYIIGTMNTADRSIGHIDYALRRRFAFFQLTADRDVFEKYYDNENFKDVKKFKDVKNLAIDLFDKVKGIIIDNINPDYDVDDFMIGHSYFLCQSEDELTMRLEYEIIPLIEEYEKDGIIIIEKSKLKEKFEEWKK